MSENVVKWHPYPKEKPDPYFTCLVTVHLPHKNIVGCDYMTPHNGWWKNNDNEVIAWAELPEPHNPPIEKKRPVHIDYFGENADDVWGWKDDKDGEKE